MRAIIRALETAPTEGYASTNANHQLSNLWKELEDPRTGPQTAAAATEIAEQTPFAFLQFRKLTTEQVSGDIAWASGRRMQLLTSPGALLAGHVVVGVRTNPQTLRPEVIRGKLLEPKPFDSAIFTIRTETGGITELNANIDSVLVDTSPPPPRANFFNRLSSLLRGRSGE